MDEKSLTILHVSSKESPKDNEVPWLYINVVFKVEDEHDIIVCDGYSDTWTKNYLYEVENPEQIDLHYQHTTHKFVPIKNSDSLTKMVSTVDPKYDISDTKRSGWSYNSYCFLQKAKKPNVYFYRDYVEDNLVTRAALQLIQDLKDNKESTSRFVEFSTFSRSLLTLNTFWD